LHLNGIPADAKLNETLVFVEKSMILRALKMTDYVQAHAAELLGITRPTLYDLLQKNEIAVPERAAEG
jgi:two-component system NtrC family response regulator